MMVVKWDNAKYQNFRILLFAKTQNKDQQVAGFILYDFNFAHVKLTDLVLHYKVKLRGVQLKGGGIGD